MANSTCKRPRGSSLRGGGQAARGQAAGLGVGEADEDPGPRVYAHESREICGMGGDAALAQGRDRDIVEFERRQMRDQRVGRQKQGGALARVERFELGQRVRLCEVEPPCRGARQAGQVGATPQGGTDVLPQGADVGASAALNVEHRARQLTFNQFERANMNGAWWPLDVDTGARVFVERAPLVLE